MAKVVLGDEYDRRAVKKARSALRWAGARRKRSWWGLGGSQELVEEAWWSAAGPLVLASETYKGLTLEGPDEVVEAVAERMAHQP